LESKKDGSKLNIYMERKKFSTNGIMHNLNDVKKKFILFENWSLFPNNFCAHTKNVQQTQHSLFVLLMEVSFFPLIRNIKIQAVWIQNMEI